MPALTFPTAIGDCQIEWSDAGVTRFRLPGDAALGSQVPEKCAPKSVLDLVERVRRHVSGEPQDFSDAPFDFSGVSPFQRAVYDAALTVKSGSTRTYGWIAETIGQPPSASRAVGTALGSNPWPLLVPCHRFLSASGKMTGFSAPGGIQTKLRLLALEGSELFGE